MGTEMPMFMQRDRICARVVDHHYATQYHRPSPSAERRHESILLSFQPEANTEDGFNLLLPKPIPAFATTGREILVRFTDPFPFPHVVVFYFFLDTYIGARQMHICVVLTKDNILGRCLDYVPTTGSSNSKIKSEGKDEILMYP
jgi:hypothetical protein